VLQFEQTVKTAGWMGIYGMARQCGLGRDSYLFRQCAGAPKSTPNSVFCDLALGETNMARGAQILEEFRGALADWRVLGEAMKAMAA
jgi:hypothetical protein